MGVRSPWPTISCFGSAVLDQLFMISNGAKAGVCVFLTVRNCVSVDFIKYVFEFG